MPSAKGVIAVIDKMIAVCCVILLAATVYGILLNLSNYMEPEFKFLVGMLLVVVYLTFLVWEMAKYIIQALWYAAQFFAMCAFVIVGTCLVWTINFTKALVKLAVSFCCTTLLPWWNQHGLPTLQEWKQELSEYINTAKEVTAQLTQKATVWWCKTAFPVLVNRAKRAFWTAWYSLVVLVFGPLWMVELTLYAMARIARRALENGWFGKLVMEPARLVIFVIAQVRCYYTNKYRQVKFIVRVASVLCRAVRLAWRPKPVAPSFSVRQTVLFSRKHCSEPVLARIVAMERDTDEVFYSLEIVQTGVIVETVQAKIQATTKALFKPGEKVKYGRQVVTIVEQPASSDEKYETKYIIKQANGEKEQVCEADLDYYLAVAVYY